MNKASVILLMMLPIVSFSQVEIDTTLSYHELYHEISISVDGEHMYNVAIKEPRTKISRGWISVTDRHGEPLDEEQIEHVMLRFFPEKTGNYYLLLKNKQ